MRLNLLGAFAIAAVVGGCTAQAETRPEDPVGWGRADCQLVTGNPLLEQEYEQARAICTSRAQAASVAGTANMPSGYGMGGAIVAGMNKGITGSQIGSATAHGCMSELGYLFKARSEHLAMCEAIAEQKQRMAAAASPVGGKRRSVSPIPPRQRFN